MKLYNQWIQRRKKTSMEEWRSFLFSRLKTISWIFLTSTLNNSTEPGKKCAITGLRHLNSYNIRCYTSHRTVMELTGELNSILVKFNQKVFLRQYSRNRWASRKLSCSVDKALLTKRQFSLVVWDLFQTTRISIFIINIITEWYSIISILILNCL